MEEATAHFQLLNNAYPYLREVMWCQNCSLQMQPIQNEFCDIIYFYICLF